MALVFQRTVPGCLSLFFPHNRSCPLALVAQLPVLAQAALMSAIEHKTAWAVFL